MKAFVFLSSNVLLGKFSFEEKENLEVKLREFGLSHPLQPYDYVKAEGDTWTLMPADAGWELIAGRQLPPAKPIVPEEPALGAPHKYASGYEFLGLLDRVARYGAKPGMIIGGICFVIGLLLLLIANEHSEQVQALLPLRVGFWCAVNCGLLYLAVTFGSHLLRATLDIAASCPQGSADTQQRIEGGDQGGDE